MANCKQHRAIAERRHIRTEINRRLSRAFRVAKIMHINMLHERSCELQTSIHPLFSAIWRMICASFSGSSSSKTNSINSGTRPLLHIAAGGLRTSVTKRGAA